MATTTLLQRHAGEGETIAEAIRDCLDYGKDPEKTESGKYISCLLYTSSGSCWTKSCGKSLTALRTKDSLKKNSISPSGSITPNTGGRGRVDEKPSKLPAAQPRPKRPQDNPVSYTHLDVYKRQAMRWLLLWRQTASPASIRKVS